MPVIRTVRLWANAKYPNGAQLVVLWLLAIVLVLTAFTQHWQNAVFTIAAVLASLAAAGWTFIVSSEN